MISKGAYSLSVCLSQKTTESPLSVFSGEMFIAVNRKAKENILVNAMLLFYISQSISFITAARFPPKSLTIHYPSTVKKITTISNLPQNFVFSLCYYF
jgi:hypothetical protein